MPNRNTTLNLPDTLIAKAKAYAAARGTTMTAIIRSHLEAVTAEEGQPGEDVLSAYAEGLIGREQAMRKVGVRDYAELLVALGDAGLAPPRPPPHHVENEAVTFARIWRST